MPYTFPPDIWNGFWNEKSPPQYRRTGRRAETTRLFNCNHIYHHHLSREIGSIIFAGAIHQAIPCFRNLLDTACQLGNRCTDFMLIIRIEVAIIIAANRFTFASQGIDDSSDFWPFYMKNGFKRFTWNRIVGTSLILGQVFTECFLNIELGSFFH